MAAPPRRLRVCLWGTFERSYARNQIIVEALRANGVDLEISHEPVWEKTRDKTHGYARAAGKLRLARDLSLAQLRLMAKGMRKTPPDVFLVGYLGHFDMPAAFVLGRLLRRPVVLDAFLSLYDTSVLDRAVVKEGSPMASVLRGADRFACQLADFVLVDTREHAEFFASEFKVPPAKLGVLPVGAEQVYQPMSAEGRPEQYTILHYSKFTPLHGLEYVIGAAALLQETAPDVRFELVGSGQVKDDIVALAQEKGVTNVAFIDFMEQSKLVQRIASADLCLGIFGRTAKASRVVPNKVYQCMAMGRPVITGRSPASERLLVHGKDVWMCEMADERSLADAILKLKSDPKLAGEIGEGGARAFAERYSARPLGELLVRMLEQVASGAPAPRPP
jgi:glycosyltransferase involved in cell wall biosynthesis